MTPEQARNAVADALESGDYQQGVGVLCKIVDGKEYHCCLGVACEVFAKCRDLDTYTDETGKEYNNCVTGLPYVVMGWLGFKDDIGSYGETSLPKENDQGATFEELANLFREPPKGLLG